MALKSRNILLLEVNDSLHPTTGQNILRWVVGVVGVSSFWEVEGPPAALSPVWICIGGKGPRELAIGDMTSEAAAATAAAAAATGV